MAFVFREAPSEIETKSMLSIVINVIEGTGTLRKALLADRKTANKIFCHTKRKSMLSVCKSSEAYMIDA